MPHCNGMPGWEGGSGRVVEHPQRQGDGARDRGDSEWEACTGENIKIKKIKYPKKSYCG